MTLNLQDVRLSCRCVDGSRLGNGTERLAADACAAPACGTARGGSCRVGQPIIGQPITCDFAYGVWGQL